MFNKITILLLFTFTAFTSVSAYGKTHIGMTGYKPLKEMLDSLFLGYEKRIRPFHKGAPLEIQVNTYIVELLHVDEFHQEFTLDLFIREYWVEPRLTFVPKPNIGSVIHLDPEHSKQIWVPDTFIANERKEMYYEGTIMQEWIRLKSDGEVRRSIRRTLTAACPSMKFYFYPFDRHRCTLDIESYRQDAEHLHYDWRGGSITPELFATGIAWNATNGTVVPFRVMSLHATKYDIEFSSGNFSRLAVEITLRKFWGIHFAKFYTPLFLFLLISLTTLFIRQSLGFIFNFINLICMHLFLLVPEVGAAVPRTEYYKANDVYLYFSLIFLYISFVVSIALLVGHKNREPGFEYKEPQTYVRVGKDLNPDETLRKKDGQHHQVHHIQTQTTFQSSIEKIIKVCGTLRWVLVGVYFLIQFIFWIIVISFSKAYIWAEELVLVDYDF